MVLLVVYLETSCVAVLDRVVVIVKCSICKQRQIFTVPCHYKYLSDIMTFPQAHQIELVALADLAGIAATPGIFRIALELLALEISPEDIYVLLKQICPRTPSEEAATPNVSGTQPPEDEKSEKS